MAAYVPDTGDVVWLDFDPQAGREQAGHRPALVLTNARYNRTRGLMISCPMTSRIKGYVFEVIVSREPPSVVLADHVKTVDWRARRATYRGSVPRQTLLEVRAKTSTLLQMNR